MSLALRRALGEGARKMEKALARLNSHAAQPSVMPLKRSTALSTLCAGDAVDLPRLCSLHDGRAYLSRYIVQPNGRLVYAQSIRLVESLHDQYEAFRENAVIVNASACAEETCPWCGARGFASILCRRCKAELCYGRTAAGWFRCRPNCGSEGALDFGDRLMQGAVPCIPEQAPGRIAR